MVPSRYIGIFSHPLAFTEHDRGQFERIWKDVGLACESATGLSQRVVTPAQSESVVTAKFFCKYTWWFCQWCSLHRHWWRDFGYFQSGKTMNCIGKRHSDLPDGIFF